MRIAQLANFYGPRSGGLRTAVDALGKGYVAAGHERLLLVPGEQDSLHTTEHGHVATFRAPRLGGTGYRVVVSPWRLVDVLERFGPTSVELSDKSTLLPIARWARRNRVGTVLLSHERLDTHLLAGLRRRAGLRLFTDAVNRYLLRTFDQVVVTSKFAAAEFARVGGDLVRRVPLGVDLRTFQPRPRVGGSSGLARLIHVGRLSDEKRPDLAIATAIELWRRGVAFEMDVYGDGPAKESLIQAAGGAPITFHPYLADRSLLADRIADADVALSVCPDETFGLAILEALACGTPVVTANRGGGPELLTPECGECAPPTPERLADAVVEILQRPVEERRAAARRQAERFPWSRSVAAMLRIHQLSFDGGCD